MAATTVPAQLLAAIKGRKFTASALSKLFASDVDFQAWTNAGHWVASDAATIAKILEVWYTPGLTNNITFSNETTGPRNMAILEYEMTWQQPDEQPRVLRQVYILTMNKAGKIATARVYCPGPHIDFPEVDLEKQRRARGLAAPKAMTAAATTTAKAS